MNPKRRFYRHVVETTQAKWGLMRVTEVAGEAMKGRGCYMRGVAGRAGGLGFLGRERGGVDVDIDAATLIKNNDNEFIDVSGALDVDINYSPPRYFLSSPFIETVEDLVAEYRRAVEDQRANMSSDDEPPGDEDEDEDEDENDWVPRLQTFKEWEFQPTILTSKRVRRPAAR